MQEAVQPRLLRFGAFEADLGSGELRKDGVRLKFSGQPFQVLAILLERPGEVVTREELQKRLWPDTFVDAERNLNTAVNKIREVLGDSAESPRFVETMPRRGYRFIAPVQGDFSPAHQGRSEQPIDQPARLGRHRNFRLAILSGAALLATGFVLWFSLVRTRETPRVVRFTPLTNDGQRKAGPILTDGVRIYFNELLPDGREVVAQVSVHGGEVSSLPVPLKGPTARDLSRDGTELLIASADGHENSIWIQPVAGGSPLRVGAILADDAAFGADGTSIIYSLGHDVFTVNRDGSSPRRLFSVQYYPGHFRYSPDRKILRFTQRSLGSDVFLLMGAAADGTGLREMFRSGPGDWSPDGKYFIMVRRDPAYRNGHLEVWALSEAKLFPWIKKDTEPIPLTSGPFEFWWPISGRDEREIYSIAWNHRAEVVRYDSHDRGFAPYLGGISAEGLAFSPDRQWVAYTTYPDGTLWRSRIDGSERLQLTSPPMITFMPRWSPDGKRIAFNALLPAPATWNIYVISSAGGSAEHLLPSEQRQIDVDWSPDGKSLIFGSPFEPDRGIYLLDLESRRVSVLPGSIGLFSPHPSPDGRYISGTTAGAEKLMLFDTSTQKWTKPCDCVAAYPTWSRDGTYLYFLYYPAPDKAQRIVRLRISDRKIEDVVEISKAGRVADGSFGAWFGLGPDDSPLLARDISTQEIYALEMKWH